MDIADRIKPLVEEIAFKSVEIDEPLYTSNLIDSMGTVDLAMMLEDEFDIKIDTRDIIESNFDSISKLVNYIKSRIGDYSSSSKYFSAIFCIFCSFYYTFFYKR